MEENKSQLRKRLLSHRKSISASEFKVKNKELLELVGEFLRARSFSSAFLFYPLKGEPDITPLSREGSLIKKPVALPVVKSQTSMCFYQWKQDIPLKAGSHGTLEPDPKHELLLEPDEESVIFVPSVALDEKGYRLGMGAGFYDRYLQRFPIGLKVGVVFHDYFMKALPHEPHDEKVDVIITDQTLITF